MKLTYRKPKELRATNSSDSDYALAEDRRSVSGNIGTLGGCITDWQSSTQQTVSLSSAEAEYYSAAKGAQGIIFKNNLLTELFGKAVTPGMLIEDNEGCIFMVKNQSTSARTKHIDIRAHFMREHYMKGSFDIIKTDTLEQDADALTKYLPEKITRSTRRITGMELYLPIRIGKTLPSRSTTTSKATETFRHRGRMSRWLLL